MSHVMIKSPDEYIANRSFDFIGTYIKDAALYLSKVHNVDIEKCEKWVKKQLAENGQFPVHNPVVKYIGKDENGDRVKRMTHMKEYLNQVERTKSIIAPTFTVYCNPDVKESEVSKFLTVGLGERDIIKSAMFKAIAEGKKELSSFYDREQVTVKVINNSTSGAHVSAGNPLYNRSAHSTLTSTCRTAASFSNSNAERFIAGRRHFYNANIAIQNIISVLNHSDKDKCKFVLMNYKLHLPTYEEMREAIKMSTDIYWRSESAFYKIEELLKTLTPLENAIYLYTQDMYHLMKFNPQFVRTMFDEMIKKPTKPIENADAYFKLIDVDLGALFGLLFTDLLNGKGIKSKEVKESAEYGVIGSGIKNVVDTLSKYSLFYSTFWMNQSIPFETANVPYMVRKPTLGGDTDSTLFTVEDWVLWHQGSLDYNPTAVSVAGTMIYFVSQLVAHILASASAMKGIPKPKLYNMAMKNEYLFPVFMTTSMSKHYACTLGAREGQVLAHHELETKGVGLKNSKAPARIMKMFDNMLEEVCQKLTNNEDLYLYPYLEKIAKEEAKIYKSIMTADTDFLSSARINSRESYLQGFTAEEMRDNDKVAMKLKGTNYKQYELWEEVFAPKYGSPGLPPYDCVKLSADVETGGDMRLFLDSIADRELATRFENWLKKEKKDAIKTYFLPKVIIETIGGVPEELMLVVNVRKIVATIMSSYYIILESFGYFAKNKPFTRLIIDDFPQYLPLKYRKINKINLPDNEDEFYEYDLSDD